MSQQKNQPQPTVTLTQTPDYREGYANSVQVRMSVWDFCLVFGQMQSQSQDEVEMKNFQAIYLSPQQAKALANVLTQNVAQYEQTFGTLALEPHVSSQSGPIH